MNKKQYNKYCQRCKHLLGIKNNATSRCVGDKTNHTIIFFFDVNINPPDLIPTTGKWRVKDIQPPAQCPYLLEMTLDDNTK